MPAPAARFSHTITITITQASWNARKVWEAVCSPGSLSLTCRNNLPTPPGPPLKIYHMALRAPLLVFNQILCFGKEFVIWAIRVFSLNLFSSKPTSSQKLPFLFPSPLFLSLSGDLVKVAPPPNHSSPALPQVPPKCSSLFSEICIFHFHFFPSAAVLLPIHKFSLNLTQRTPFSFSFNVSSHLQMSEKWLSINCQKKLSVFSYFINVHQKGTDYLIWLPQSWFFASIFFFVTLVDKMDDNLDDKMVAALHLAWSPGCPR